VVRFYEKVIADPSVAPFFAGFDLDAQVKKQIAFMTMAFGGPHRYTGRNLRVAHAPLVERGLGDAHFDAIGGHLKATLDELGVDAATTGEVLAIVETTRKDVLGR
jgi:hemoglobin